MEDTEEKRMAERKSGLDCRQTKPTEVKPYDCAFLTCQIGRLGVTSDGETTFHLMACGRTWDRALEVLSQRKT